LLPYQRKREMQLFRLEVDFARGEIWKPFTVADPNLYTGQNPASAASLAEELGKVANYPAGNGVRLISACGDPFAGHRCVRC
jgi:hypothetical protein